MSLKKYFANAHFSVYISIMVRKPFDRKRFTDDPDKEKKDARQTHLVILLIILMFLLGGRLGYMYLKFKASSDLELNTKLVEFFDRFSGIQSAFDNITKTIDETYTDMRINYYKYLKAHRNRKL